MRGLSIIASAILLCGAAAALAAEPSPARPIKPSTRTTPAGDSTSSTEDYFRWRRSVLTRIVEVGYRVAHATGGACAGEAASLGLAIEQRDQFAADDRTAAGFEKEESLPRVVAVASGSSADQAGLQKGDMLALWPRVEVAPSASPTFAVIDRGIASIEARMLAALANRQVAGNKLTLPVIRAGLAHDLVIPVEPGCSAWFDFKQAGPADASSDSHWIQLTNAVLDLIGQDDNQLAFIVGHEMGHRVMRLDRHGRDELCDQSCEERADRLGLEFAERAGFSGEQAPTVLIALASVRPGFLGGRRRALLARAARLQQLIEHGMRRPLAPGRGSASLQPDGGAEAAPALPNPSGDGKSQ